MVDLVQRYSTPIVYVLLVMCLLKIMLPKYDDTNVTNEGQDDKMSLENLSESAQKYSNFYLEGSQNIDLKDFKLVINNDICGDDDIKIITIVTTALENDVSKEIGKSKTLKFLILGLSRCDSQVLGIS